MQSLRLRLKKDIRVFSEYADNISIMLKEGVEYDVEIRRGEDNLEEHIIYVPEEGCNVKWNEDVPFWNCWCYAPMSELDFREIFDANNETMFHIKDDMEQGFYSSYYDVACNHMLECYLDDRGLCLNEDMYSPERVIGVILSRREYDENYTMEDWIKGHQELGGNVFKK